jgi:hypothetical protein
MKQVSTDNLLIFSDKYDDKNACPEIPCAKWQKKRAKKLTKYPRVVWR